MKTSSTQRWIGTVVLFIILYLLSESVLFWLFDGHFRLFTFGSRLGLNTGISINFIYDIKYFFVSDPYNSGVAGLAAALGLGVLIGSIILFCLSYYITSKIFSNKK